MKRAHPLVWLSPPGGALRFKGHQYVTEIGGELWIVDHVRRVREGWSYELVRRVRRGDVIEGGEEAVRRVRDRLVGELFDLGDVVPRPAAMDGVEREFGAVCEVLEGDDG